MKRLTIVAACLFAMTVALAAGPPRPEISGITPATLAPSNTTQSLLVAGRDFAPGLSLSVTNPGGRVAEYRGNAIVEQRDTSFRVAVMLPDTGTYRFVVVNPDGQTSAPYSLSVKSTGDGPTAREVRPAGLRISSSPQPITVEGSGFEPGMSVSVTDPSGEVQTLSGDAIKDPLPTSFQLTLRLELPGHYELVVTNPNGKTSSVLGFEVGRRP